MITNNFILNIISVFINLIDVLCVILPVLLAVAFMTIIERKQLAAHQRRVGPVKCYGKTLLWVKLSNSGDTLKTVVPSYSRKAISGGLNQPCMVISYSMSENEMGYRGSKSEIQYSKPNIISVKEQRVDGSWFLSLKKARSLRCTLMGGESRYQFKIPSNQINNKKYYSYYSNSKSTLAITNLNPYFLTGFSDAEASFIIIILKEPKNKTN